MKSRFLKGRRFLGAAGVLNRRRFLGAAGATGVSMHVLQAMQLTGTAGGIQVKDADLCAVFNMGGAAVANYVSILQRLR